MLRMGQDAGQDAIKASAERLKKAISNLRGNIDDASQEKTSETREFARLNLQEFEELPDYATLKEIIDGRLDEAAIEHDFVEVDGHDHLVFRVADASEVDEVFATLEQDVDVAAERACEERDKALAEARDSEPLEVKALAAKEASKAVHEAKEASRQIEKVEVKSR